MQSYHTNTYINVRVSMVSLEASHSTRSRRHTRGHTPAQPSCCPLARPCRHWGRLSPALSAASTAQKSSVAAVAASAASAVEAAVERGAVLVASAAEDRLLGVDVDAGHHWQVLRHLGLIGRAVRLRVATLTQN